MRRAVLIHITMGCLLGCLVSLGQWGCAPASTSRESWVQQHLLDDNWYLLERDRSLVEEKFRKMAANLYNFFRGTVRLYLFDSMRANELASPTAYGTGATMYVASVVDPHPENIGSYYMGYKTLNVDFNDFDGSTYAPYFLDVRRLTVGFLAAALLAKMDQKEPQVYEQLHARIAEGYVRHIQELKEGKPALQIRYRKGFGTIVDDLLKRAGEQGPVGDKLQEYTRLKDGKRVMHLGTIETTDIDGVVRKDMEALSEHEAKFVKKLMQSYLPTRLDAAVVDSKHFAIKGMAKRLGAGVSSYPRLRYYVLVEGPTHDLRDDMLLEFKEIADASLLPGYQQLAKQSFTSNGERVVMMQRRLQEANNNDIHLGWANVAPMSFRVRHLTSYQKNFGTDRFTEKYNEKKWSSQDLLDFAFLSGRLLARAHAKAPMFNERPGQQVITDALSQSPQGFVSETAAFARRYVEQLQQDYQAFQDLRKKRGPLLGYRPPLPVYR
ncbi:MAG: DUF2252 domain-containing protein [Deltaproteobacteria bacterium]|nr:MAG: DUF2252 domain-containing protein [Deltaproteobacteria bacterium]